MLHYIYTFCDKLEDRIRGKLSRKPIAYALIGGIGVVLFWRGVWHSVDYLMERYFLPGPIDPTQMLWWDGPLSFILGITILLLSGIFVSTEIGNEVIISGLRGEKKLIEKTKDEIESEMYSLASMQKDLQDISMHLKKTPKKKSRKTSFKSSKQLAGSLK